jgi:hypothetical protein
MAGSGSAAKKLVMSGVAEKKTRHDTMKTGTPDGVARSDGQLLSFPERICHGTLSTFGGHG